MQKMSNYSSFLSCSRPSKRGIHGFSRFFLFFQFFKYNSKTIIFQDWKSFCCLPRRYKFSITLGTMSKHHPELITLLVEGGWEASSMFLDWTDHKYLFVLYWKKDSVHRNICFFGCWNGTVPIQFLINENKFWRPSRFISTYTSERVSPNLFNLPRWKPACLGSMRTISRL